MTHIQRVFIEGAARLANHEREKAVKAAACAPHGCKRQREAEARKAVMRALAAELAKAA